MPRILLVDDNKDLLSLLSMRIAAEGYELQAVESAEKALASIPTFRPQVVITDLRMDGMDGMTLFEHLKEEQPTLPVIMLTAHGSIPHAIEATKRGAFSYLTKPFDSTELLAEIEKAMTVNGGAEPALKEEHGWSDEIITRNSAMQEVLSQARVVAGIDTSVFIQSESGTGKELLAQAIHRASPRARMPFLAINCSAVPEALLESELFGHSKGAFTGAVKEYQGLFQAAKGGTLFLDEIGDMPLGFQAKLLRVLQEKEVRPVGSTQSVPIDVRIISATHADLEAAVREKRFREDLYYRLNVVQLDIPPLRERRDDIPLLANRFLRDLCEKHNTPARHFSSEAMELLVSAPYPGNVRQLQNIVEQTMVLSHTTVIPARLVQRALKVDSGDILPFVEARDHFERSYLIDILRITQGNVTQAAHFARRNRTEFYRLLRRHHLDPRSFRSYPSQAGASGRQ